MQDTDALVVFACGVCSERFSSHALRLHHARMSPACLYSLCSLSASQVASSSRCIVDSCHFTSSTPSEARRHFYSCHTDKLRFECPVADCKGRLSNSTMRAKHLRYDHSRFLVTCHSCDDVFDVNTNLKHHLAQEHGISKTTSDSDAPEDENDSDAETQPAVKNSPKQQRSSVQQGREFRRRSVSVVARGMSSSSSISSPSLPGPGPGSRDLTSRRIRRHKSQESQRGPPPRTAVLFACDNCDQRFAEKADIISHKRVHRVQQNRHFVCRHCGFRTFEKSEIESHSANAHVKSTSFGGGGSAGPRLTRAASKRARPAAAHTSIWDFLRPQECRQQQQNRRRTM